MHFFAEQRVRRVFVSSTFRGLGKHRREVVEAVRRLDFEAGAVEVLAADPGSPLKFCRELIDRCDLLVVLSGVEAGTVPTVSQGGDGRRSFTWHEVAYATEKSKIPVFAFISADAYTASVDYPARAFNDWLYQQFKVDQFDDPASAAVAVVCALARYCMQPRSPRGAPGLPGVVRLEAVPAPDQLLGRSSELVRLDEWHQRLDGDSAVFNISSVGGSGKSALLGTWLRRTLDSLERSGAVTHIWSFADRADPVAYLRSLSDALLGQSHLDADHRLAEVADALSDGRDYLLVMDGLDRVLRHAAPDECAEASFVEELVRLVDHGIGRTRILSTSRYALGYEAGVSELPLSPLPDAAARELLLSSKAQLGPDEVARCLTATGNHALSLRALASLLRYFGAKDLDPALLARVPRGNDESASALALVLAEYTGLISREERDVVAAVCSFPKGLPIRPAPLPEGSLQRISTSVAMTPSHVDVRGAAARLVEAGVLEEVQYRDAIVLSAHAFLRNWFRPLLGCSDDEVNGAVSVLLGKSQDDPRVAADRGTDFLMHQLSTPNVDWIAPLTAWWFNLMNYDANVGAVESLGSLDGQRVLDIGFGGGLAVRALLQASGTVIVDAVDASQHMIRVACETFADDIRSARLRLQRVEVGAESLAFPNATFDSVVTVCTLPFWSDIPATLAEIRRLLRPGGNLRLVMESYRLEYLLEFPKQGFATLRDQDVIGLLASQGFTNVGVSLIQGLGGTCTLISARRPDSSAV
jgi:SAM-dependent methyltransferase